MWVDVSRLRDAGGEIHHTIYVFQLKWMQSTPSVAFSGLNI